MPGRDAEVNLILKARDLASREVGKVEDAVKKVGPAAKGAGTGIGIFGGALRAAGGPLLRIAELILDLILNSEEGQKIVRTLSDAIGKVLAPILRVVGGFLNETLIPAINTVSEAISDWMEANRPLIEQVKTFASSVLKGLADAFGGVLDVVGRVVGFLWGDGRGPLPIALGAVGAAFGVFRSIIEGALSVIGTILGAIGTLIERLGQAIGKVQEFVDFAKPALNAIPGLPFGFNVPGFQHGGWAGVSGPEIIRVGEREPELVIPRSQMGAGAAGGGEAVTIVGVSKRDLARIVDEQMFVLLRRAPDTLGRV